MIFDEKRVLRDEASGDPEGGVGDPVVPTPEATAEANTAALAALQTQIDALKAENTSEKARATEQEQSARYWHEQAKGKPAPVKLEAEDPEPDVDPIELLSKQGSKGLNALVKKGGFVTQEQLNQAIESRARQMTLEAQLTRDYPDINDPKSDFFKAVAVEYKQMIDEGTPHLTAMRQAAKSVKLSLIEAGKIVPKAEQEERDRHAAAAGGDKSRGKGKMADADDDNDELDAFQTNICNEMADASGQDRKKFVAAYKQRSKAGVTYTGGSRF